MDEIAAGNKELVRRFYNEVYVDGTWLRGRGRIAAPRLRLAGSRPDRPASVPGLLFGDTGRVPDARYDVDDLIAEGDRVVVRWRLLGTHKGDFRGIAPTNRPIELKGIAIYRVDGGKLMERWVVSDLYGVLEQIKGSSPQ